MNKSILFLSLFFVVSCSKKVQITDTRENGPQTIRLNGPLAIGGNVSPKFEVSKERKVVYIAEETVQGIKDLYTVDLFGEERINLTKLSLGKNVKDFKLSTDGKKILFLADITTTGRDDLYTINLDGTELHQVNAGLSTDTKKIKDYRFFNSSYNVIYISDEQIENKNDLYVSNYNGQNRVSINQKTGITDFFTLKSDDSIAVFGIKQVAGVKAEVLSARVDNSQHYDISKIPSSPNNQEVLVFSKPNEFGDIVFGINDDGGSTRRLFKNDWTGSSSPIRISPPSGGDDLQDIRGSLVFSPDSKFVAYEKYQNPITRLYVSSTQIQNTSLIKEISNPTQFLIKKMIFSNDSTKIIYTELGSGDLFSVNVDGTSSTKINMNKVHSFSEKGGRIYFLEENNNDSKYNLMSSNLNGGDKRLESPVLSTGIGFNPFSTGSSYSLGDYGPIMAGSPNSSLAELYFKGTSLPIEGEITSSMSDERMTLLPFENKVIYRAFDGTSNHLYITRITE